MNIIRFGIGKEEKGFVVLPFIIAKGTATEKGNRLSQGDRKWAMCHEGSQLFASLEEAENFIDSCNMVKSLDNAAPPPPPLPKRYVILWNGATGACIEEACKWHIEQEWCTTYATLKEAKKAFPNELKEIQEWVEREREYIARTEKHPLQPWLW